MQRKERLFVWGIVVIRVAGRSDGRGLIGYDSSANLSFHLSRRKGDGAPPNLLGTWEGTWTSRIPSGSMSPDSGTVYLVVTQQSGETLQADITVYEPSRGESISSRVVGGKIKGDKVTSSGTVMGTQARGTYSGTLIKGSGKGGGNKSEQDWVTWTLMRS
ncbi:MAG: hypothetical protein NZT92_17500 [Abditibacteriales bacterium]|nr:hypothetical protein [Abditibacteriales bacterium]MDW8367644.1 hypothetical protein [Abditibacteriales bacterium]